MTLFRVFLIGICSGLLFVPPSEAITAAVSAQDTERIPVLAWGGPPADQTTSERYQELAAAGFTHNFSNFSSAEAMAAALEVAHAAGIKQLISIPELAKEPEETARRFKDHPALGGYYLRDEPSAADFPMLSEWAKRIQTVDQGHACYINLFPNYATGAQLGTATYQEYLDRFAAEVPVSYLSFDHYPVAGDQLRPEWYENLELVAKKARATQKAFWAFALAVAHGPYPIPTVAELRLQVFSNLAYGAQGIQYFTYWTFKSSDWNFHEAPIDVDGRRTPVYDRVKQVNEEVRGLSAVFLGARVLQVGHTGPLPRGTKSFQPAMPLTALQTEGGGAVVSLLENGTRRYLAIVNRDFRGALSLAVTFDPAAGVRSVRKDGTTDALSAATYSTPIDPGDLVLLTWETKR